MTNVLVLKEENKMSRLLKDERGMTLVELLATVVILAIIAAIGVTAIGQVIQNSKEDAGVANVQQAMNAGKLYQSTNSTNDMKSFALKDVIDGGYLEVPTTTWNKPEAVLFEIDGDGVVKITVPEKSLKAGSKDSKALTKYSNDQILSLDRKILFGTKTTP
ncbi:type II secretion system protein [Vagococcus coleopterorum]|uniref:Type II secretion system protein n=1 Tax=Vagococcus coleopterorum TaxID=2714946 RepID=A0A6G8ALJ8_9ENTE|nr:type II secretion system protein [Vagococcus coleopterorum]QIL45805.1 type II secretion system protein [Vagococcus coleopterorum]